MQRELSAGEGVSCDDEAQGIVDGFTDAAAGLSGEGVTVDHFSPASGGSPGKCTGLQGGGL